MSEKTGGPSPEDVEITPENLSEKDFIAKYPENGFGWSASFDDPESVYNQLSKRIGARWVQIHKEHREEETIPTSDKIKNHPQTSEFKPPYTRNIHGQIVGKNNEPIKSGSKEWSDAAKHNLIPLNQNKRK